MSIISIRKMSKSYGDRKVLNNVSLEIERGECISIMGPSGCGKSTLLNILGLLEPVESGQYIVDGVCNPNLRSKDGIHLRRYEFSYLFQNFGLIDNMTVEDNVRLATKFMRLSRKDEHCKILEALSKVNLQNKEKLKIYQLSGGEQQRVALARCFLKPNSIILADEPTGNLDRENRNLVLEMLDKLNDEGKTIIVVTHDQEVGKWAKREIKFQELQVFA